MRLPDALRGIACMVSGSLLLTISDALTKWLAAGYPVGEIIVLRGLVVIALVTLYARRRAGLSSLVPRRWPGHLLRGGFAGASTFLFILGLTYLPLADAVAIAFAGPLYITALAGPLLGERVGWRRWCAVLAGFAGVVLMVQPAGEGLRLAALLPLTAALCGALRDLVTRRITAGESSVSILLTSNLIVVVAGVASSLAGDWSRPAPGDLLLLGGAGMLLGVAHYLHIEAFRFSEAAAVAPFKYTSMIWAVLLGLVVWGQLPGWYTWAGMALLVASGLYILRREQRGAAVPGPGAGPPVEPGKEMNR